jgi:Type II secretion system (T2SS), protein G
MASQESNRTLWIVLIIAGVGGAGVFLVGGLICAGVLIRGSMRAEQAQIDACLERIAQLDDAVDRYHLQYGSYPPDLESLFQPGPLGAPPLLDDPELLNDPWGEPFEYDVTGPRNYGSRPDIWADREDEIGNWQLPAPTKK